MRRRNVAYIRVARESSEDIEYQKRIIDEYAKNNNLRIDYYYVDDGYSGTTLNRPVLQQMLRDVKSKKITDRIIYVDLSRLGRSFKELDKIISQTSKRDVKLISLKEFENYKTDITTFFHQRMRNDNLERIKKEQELKIKFMKKDKVNLKKLNFYCRIGNPNDLKENILSRLSKNGNKILEEKYKNIQKNIG